MRVTYSRVDYTSTTRLVRLARRASRIPARLLGVDSEAGWGTKHALDSLGLGWGPHHDRGWAGSGDPDVERAGEPAVGALLRAGSG